MSFINYIIKFTCNFVYTFMKIKKTNYNKVVFISRLSNKKTLDFELLEKELLKENKNIECVFLCRRIVKFSDGILGNVIYTLKCLSNLANAKVCVTDSFTIAVSSVKHKKSLKIIQIWHSMGAIKKFGCQSLSYNLGRDKKTSKILNIHANYDYIISGSKEMTKYFALAFGYDESSFLNYGLPRIDYLINNEDEIKNKILKQYKELKNKKNILYAPTFRNYESDNTLDLINSIDKNKFNLIIKSHANQDLKLNKEVYTCDEFSALELLCVSDYVITDYSAIAIEAASINKKTLYYVYDYDKYKKENGLNIDLYKEMKGCVFENASELSDFLSKDKYDMNILKRYKDKYIDVQDGTSTKKIVSLIINNLKEVNHE